MAKKKAKAIVHLECRPILAKDGKRIVSWVAEEGIGNVKCAVTARSSKAIQKVLFTTIRERLRAKHKVEVKVHDRTGLIAHARYEGSKMIDLLGSKPAAAARPSRRPAAAASEAAPASSSGRGRNTSGLKAYQKALAAFKAANPNLSHKTAVKRFKKVWREMQAGSASAPRRPSSGRGRTSSASSASTGSGKRNAGLRKWQRELKAFKKAHPEMTHAEAVAALKKQRAGTGSGGGGTGSGKGSGKGRGKGSKGGKGGKGGKGSSGRGGSASAGGGKAGGGKGGGGKGGGKSSGAIPMPSVSEVKESLMYGHHGHHKHHRR